MGAVPDDDEKQGSTAGSPKLTQGPVARRLLDMSLPMVVGILSVLAFNLADTAFIAQLGTAPLSALTFTFPVVMVLANLAIALGIGTSSVLARLIGQGDRQRVRRLTTLSLLGSGVIVLVLSLVGIATIEPLFRLLGAEEPMLPLIRDYMEVWYIGMVFLVMPMVGNAALRANGDSTFPSWIMVAAAAINVVLDPLLIFGLYGFPRLEIAGAAWASLIARALTLIVGLAVLHYRERLLTLDFGHLDLLLSDYWKVLSVAGPSSVGQLAGPLALAMVTPLVATHGEAAVAAYGVGQRIEAVAMIVPFALSAGLGPVMGQNWGAGRRDRARQAVQLALLWSFLWGLGLMFVIWLFRDAILVPFDLDPDAYKHAMLFLLIVPIALGFSGVVVNAVASTNAIGRSWVGMGFNGLKMIVLTLPLAFVGNWIGGLAGIFIGLTAGGVLSGLIVYGIIRRLIKGPQKLRSQ